VSRRELRIDITGNADRFGEAAKKTKASIDDLKSAGLDVLTGGLYTGGALALVTTTLDGIKSVVMDLRDVVQRAQKLNVSTLAAIDLDAFAKATGVQTATLDAGIQQARKARADALAGDDQAVRAFESIGVSLEKIRDLQPDKLFAEILEAASKADLDAKRFFGFARLIGEDTANQVLPVARSESAMRLARSSPLSGTSENLVRGPANVALQAVGAAVRFAVDRLRQPFEPFSSFGLQNQDQTNDAAEINRQKLALVARAQLTTEQRINEAIAERLRLSRLIEDEADPLKRQKLIANLLNVEGEIGGLAAKRGTELTATPITRTQDPLRAVGADFSPFFARREAETGRQQLEEIRRLRSTVAEGLQRVERAIGEELGP
jgi:hypothetical protein